MSTEETTNETEVTATNAVNEEGAEFNYGLDNVTLDTNEDVQATDMEASAEEATEEVEYKLDLGEVDESDQLYVSLMTNAAKNAGIDSKAASACFLEFTKALEQSHLDATKQQHDALVKEWGRNFKTKAEATQKFMLKVFTDAGFSKEEMEQFATPTGIRLFSKLRESMKGGRFAGANQVPVQTKAPKEELKELMQQWATLRYTNGSASDIESVRAKINKLSMKVHGVNVV